MGSRPGSRRSRSGQLPNSADRLNDVAARFLEQLEPEQDTVVGAAAIGAEPHPADQSLDVERAQGLGDRDAISGAVSTVARIARAASKA